MSKAWIQNLRGRFLVFDGPDGSGKSTQFQRCQIFAREAGLAVCAVREPGGTLIGESVRDILLNPIHQNMDMRCEMLLYMASRAQLLTERVIPALQRGELVLADRFISSTLAYQGHGCGLPFDEIDAVAQIVLRDTQPDAYLLFDVSGDTSRARLAARHAEKTSRGAAVAGDRIEMRDEDYHARVRAGYRPGPGQPDPLHDD